MAKPRKPKTPLHAVGDAFAVPLPNGMWGGCRVIRVGGLALSGRHDPALLEVGSLAWIGARPPTGEEPDIAKLLVRCRDGFHLGIGWFPGPVPATFLPIRPIAPLPADLTRTTNRWASSWDCVAAEILEEWRWQHDREAVLQEDKARLERLAANDDVLLTVRRRELDKITLTKLRKRRAFADWRHLWPAPVLTEARQIFRDTIDSLIALGPKPGIDAARPILKTCIVRFNQLNAAHDHFIETDEREAIADHFAQMIHVARLAEYRSTDLTEQWRDW